MRITSFQAICSLFKNQYFLSKQDFSCLFHQTYWSPIHTGAIHCTIQLEYRTRWPYQNCSNWVTPHSLSVEFSIHFNCVSWFRLLFIITNHTVTQITTHSCTTLHRNLSNTNNFNIMQWIMNHDRILSRMLISSSCFLSSINLYKSM